MGDRAVSIARAPQRTPSRPLPARTDLQLVRAPGARNRPRQVVLGFVLVTMFSALLASAVFHSVLVAGQQRLDHMDQRLGQRQQVLSRSRLRVAELSSPARVVAEAQRAGMIVPDHTTWLSSGSSQAPGTSQPPPTIPGPPPPPAQPSPSSPTSPSSPSSPSSPTGHELASGAVPGAPDPHSTGSRAGP